MITEKTQLIQKALVLAGLGKQEAEERTRTMLSYMQAVLCKNKHINLTRIVEPEEFVEKHILDSLEVLMLEDYADVEKILDIGTGAGFPGVMLAIAHPNKEVVLVDARRKKLRVIDDIAGELNISNIRTVHGRAEDLSKDKKLASQFDLVVSRAVADLTCLLDWTLPFVKEGARAVYYKGPGLELEIKEAAKQIEKWHLQSCKIVESQLTNLEHVLLVLEKTRT